MPPKVKPEDTRPPALGQPRLVRCHECSSWVAWQYVAEKGAICGNPVPAIEGYPVLECWQCYIKRVDTNLRWGDVKPRFIKYNKKTRNHRVQRWQDLLSYVTCPEDEGPEAEGSKQKLKEQKHKFDKLNAENIAFERSGGGSSSTAPLDTDEDVKFRYGDQYVGINPVVYEGEDECLLFTWAGSTKKQNLAMATLVNPSGGTMTKGRTLEGDIASHNLCVISAPCAITELQQRFDPDGTKNYYAFAIGGQYRDPADERGNTDHYDGIQVMGLSKHKYGDSALWSALQWKRLHRLLKGDHPGAVEGRSKCKGIAEFDGQSALTYFGTQLFVYARANPQERGYRTVQVCHGSLDALSPFELCKFTGVPDASDIYFLHPYVVPGGRWLVAIMSLVWPEGYVPKTPRATPPGIYLALSTDGINFREPVLLHACDSHERRAYDLPVQGNVSFTETGISFYVHRNVPCRMSPKDRNRKEELVKMTKQVPPHICNLWKGL